MVFAQFGLVGERVAKLAISALHASDANIGKPEFFPALDFRIICQRFGRNADFVAKAHLPLDDFAIDRAIKRITLPVNND